MDALTLVDLLSPTAGDHPAVESDDGAIGYVALCNAADAVAAALVVRGVAAGDRVGGAFPDGAVYLAAFGGTGLARAAFVPLPLDEERTLRTEIERNAPRVILTCTGCPQALRVAGAASGIPVVTVSFDKDGTVLVDGERVFDAHGSAPQPDDVVFIGRDGKQTTHGEIAAAVRARHAQHAPATTTTAPLTELSGLIEALAVVAAGGQLRFEPNVAPAVAAP